MLQFKLYTAMGEFLMHEKLNPIVTRQEIDVSMFNNGVYYYTIESNKKNMDNGKLVILK